MSSYQTPNDWAQWWLSLGQFKVHCAACHVHTTLMYKTVQPSALEFLHSTTTRLLAYQSALLHPEVPYQKRHVRGPVAECVKHPAVLAELQVKVTALVDAWEP